MTFWKKASLFVTTALLALCLAVPAFAAGLTVKTSSLSEDVVNVAVPYIAGSRGGSEVDDKVNGAVFDVIDDQLEALLPAADRSAFKASHDKGTTTSSRLAYHKDLVKFTSDSVRKANSEVKTPTTTWSGRRKITTWRRANRSRWMNSSIRRRITRPA